MRPASGLSLTSCLKLETNYLPVKMKIVAGLFILILSDIVLPVSIISQSRTGQEKVTVSADVSASPKYGALAIDRANGFYFGWSADCPTLAEAEKRAIESCTKKGGRCTVVLSYSGTGYAVYRFITGNVGMGYGWGLANTKEEADTKAKKECAERSYGLPAPNMVWSFNNSNSDKIKMIYDAHDELKGLQPGTVTDY